VEVRRVYPRHGDHPQRDSQRPDSQRPDSQRPDSQRPDSQRPESRRRGDAARDERPPGGRHARSRGWRRPALLATATLAVVAALALVTSYAFGAAALRRPGAAVGGYPVAAPGASLPVAGSGAATGSATPRPAGSGALGRASASPTPPRPAPAVPRPSAYPTPEAAVLALVNQARAKSGCPALAAESHLAYAARQHSADMAARGYFSHDTPEGVDPGTRITQAGYRWSAWGENIAAGQPDADAVMRAWMSSPGHRANILNCGFRHIGIGLAYSTGRSPTPYWTQDFGTPR
jgi:uncharacterized protein YkwD